MIDWLMNMRTTASRPFTPSDPGRDCLGPVDAAPPRGSQEDLIIWTLKTANMLRLQIAGFPMPAGMKPLVTALLVLLVGACTPAPPMTLQPAIASKAPTASRPVIEPTHRLVVWRLMGPAEIKKEAVSRGLSPNTVGFARQKRNVCYVWTPPPSGPSDTRFMEIAYHELRHCQEGHFHD